MGPFHWHDPSPPADPYEAARIAVIVMASGGKFDFGLPSQMDGALYPEPAKRVEMAGNWYKPKRSLFTEAVPMQYRGERVPGIQVSEKNFGTIGSIYGNDKIIHIINFSGARKPLTIGLSYGK